MDAERFDSNPLIVPDMDGRMGRNVNGPSVVRVPERIDDPLGRYYMYFAHHEGTYVRMAYADGLEGPWTTYEPGVLPLEASGFRDHVASPDVHVDDGRLRMYVHGPTGDGQKSRVAVSGDGLAFDVREPLVDDYYLRVFEHRGTHYAIARRGACYRSDDPMGGFERGPTIPSGMRHAAVRVVGDRAQVFFTRIGDAPERILVSTVDLSRPFGEWEPTEPEVVLEPEEPYEGADRPVEPSERGAVYGRVRQLRDPAVFEEDGEAYLFYAVAGEHGIAGARLS